MSSYVQNSLMAGEKVLYEAKPSLWSMLPLFIMVFLFLVLYGLGLIFWLVAYWRYRSTELAITNKRVIANFGVKTVHTIELNLNKIEGIQVSQGYFGRLLNYGSLLISGTGKLQQPIPGISNRLQFRQAFTGAVDAISPHAAPSYSMQGTPGTA